MKDAWDKFKISSEALKNNWPMILVAMTAISSGIGNITQHLGWQEDKELNTALVETVTMLSPKPKKTQVIIKQDCNECGGYFNKIIENHEERLH